MLYAERELLHERNVAVRVVKGDGLTRLSQQSLRRADGHKQAGGKWIDERIGWLERICAASDRGYKRCRDAEARCAAELGLWQVVNAEASAHNRVLSKLIS